MIAKHVSMRKQFLSILSLFKRRMTSSSNDFVKFSDVKYDFLSESDGSAPVKWRIVSHEQIRTKYKKSFDAFEVAVRPPFSIPQNIRPGTQIAIIPENRLDVVDEILARLGGDVHTPRDVHLPECTGYKDKVVRLRPAEILQHVVEINRPIEKLLAALANKAKSASSELTVEQVKYLQALIDRDEKGLLELRAITDNYSLSQILKMFPKILTLDDLIKFQPKNSNRKYTISDVDHNEQVIRFMYSLTEHTTELRAFNEDESTVPRQYHGEATCMLRNLMLNKGEVVTYFDVRERELPDGTCTFKHKLPYYKVEDRPVMLVSTGVGISPHLAWLRDLKRRGVAPNIGLVISGGRYEQDEIKRDEIAQLLGTQFAKYLYVASQERESKYVQDILKEKSDFTWNLLSQQSGSLFVCGTDVMRNSVRSVLEAIGTEHGVNGAEWLNSLMKNGQLYISTSSVDRFYRKKK